MTTDEPLDLTMRKMNRVMDEMEKILRRSASRPYDASCSPFRLACVVSHLPCSTAPRPSGATAR